MAHLIFSAIFLVSIISLLIYAVYFDTQKQESGQLSTPITIVKASNAQHELPKNAVLRQSSIAETPVLPPGISTTERRVLASIPMRSNFDFGSENSIVDCNNRDCVAKLVYRQDVGHTEKANFMNYIKSLKAEQDLNSKGFTISGMTFGIDRNTHRDTVEVFLDLSRNY